MKLKNLLDLVLLSVIWGVAFLFIRVAGPEFGTVALIEVRILAALLVLVPLLLARGGASEAMRNWKPLFLMGVLHHAIPYYLFAYAMLTLTGGFASIINASSPLFAGAVAWVWLAERPTLSGLAGILVGLAGVVILVWDSLTLDLGSAGLAIGAAVLASFCYGLAAVQAKKQLAGVNPVTVSAGSMMVAGIILLPFAVWMWPATAPSPQAWSMAVLLGIVCTAVAFVLYFRLIGNVGPTKAITVTFLIPVFAVLFGALFIDEAITTSMVAGGAVILLGTAMSTGLIDLRVPWRKPVLET